MKQTVQDSKERRKRLEGGERGEEKGERDRGKNNEERKRRKEEWGQGDIGKGEG